ncbi:MAG: M81 family metallopeptidase [Candidatus Cloacimonetes bacterium]|nr:M81 family metallopeptidase [Candidatus Cloacimonadota bacterium]
MKNIAIGGFFHESNSFNPIITPKEDFLIFEDDEIHTQGQNYLQAQGIVDFFEDKKDCRLIPLVFARAVPNGLVEEALYLKLKKRFFELLDSAPRPDIFVLALHGSMRVQNIGSAESDLLESIKTRYPDLPIVCGLDMHATITQKMLNCANAMVGYKTAPHLDAWETGQHAARIAWKILFENMKPQMAAVKLPYLIAGEKSETDYPPMKDLISELCELEKQDDVCAASYLLGFPWADADENGVTALVVTKNDKNKATEYANLLANKFSELKSQFSFSVPAYPPEEALRLALSENIRPIFVSDSGDNPTAGSTADNTNIIALLSGILKEKTRGKKIVVAGIFDPHAVTFCKANLGKKITLNVGGYFDTMYCQPVELSGTPVKLLEGFGPFRSDLILFRTTEFDLIITSKHIGFTSLDMFKALKIDYMQTDVIVVKLGYLTEDFKDIAAKSFLALTRGCTDEVLSRLDYTNKYELL